ncbi:short chain dehydrogenase reductase [Grosmannia clavigera kw1407]|uniref:Short chain dehydrogenase reductase n=1 Tax=Grosmannia clavigera (strain kw1407 / UAMH 11150) TaxID=655863 RepID=F0XA45_GROCL|nr:short chain dehydrogenase reductase [Grosmannia clavigera kw1407]EFX05733.1 short chain dehydrogenase reductase [Grosmannia clavigera kw1407]
MSVFKPGNTAVITGGASGIGLALAIKCVSHGMRVVLVDVNETALAAAPTSIIEATAQSDVLSLSVATVQMDVGRPADWVRLRKVVDSHLGDQVHLLALNAGVGGPSLWTDPAAFQRIWDVNVLGVVHGLATVLPLVEATASDSTSASIIITGSKQGITNPPGTSPAYNASKAAVRSLAEQLAFDLAKRAPHVSVHLLVPGWTHTGLTGGGGSTPKPKPDGAWSPAQVIDYLVPAMAANRFYILCPDNDVTEAQDSCRVLWSAGDVAYGRAPLSRWRPEYKDEVDAFMSKEQ